MSEALREASASRTALVTGGGRGLGRAISQALAADGSFVYVAYHRREQEAEEVASAIREAGGEARAIPLDVRDAAAVRKAVGGVLEERGSVEQLINNAGVVIDEHFAMLKDSSWSEVLEVNLGGAMRCARALARPMMRAGGGAIVNIASISAIRARAGQSSYAASKGGLLALTRTLAAELGPYKVRVNAVVPGLIDAGMVRRLDPKRREEGLRHVHLGRLGRPEEVARAVRFLASEEASYITGQALVVDGGLSL